jgi:diguanylate cyclase (GGDEF)-like protein/PAS domain S-box-containing protein
MKTVLIVDDNKEDLHALGRLLRGHSYKVVSAANGIEAIETARRGPPDMILSDTLMPFVDGFALCHEWKKDTQLKTIPFVFYTADGADAKGQKLAKELGAERFIVRPIASEKLLEMVEQVLNKGGQIKPVSSERVPRAGTVAKERHSEAVIRASEQNAAYLEETTRVLKQKIADLKQRGKTVQQSETRYRRLFETALDGILILDGESGAITDVNEFLLRLLGYTRQEVVGKAIWEISPFKDAELNQEAVRRLQTSGYARYDHLPLEAKDGRRVDVEFVSNAYMSGGKRVIQCNIRDITDRRKAEERLQYLGSHDVLTGLYNRAYLEGEFDRLMLGRSFYPVGVVMVDVDGMKAVNDRLGHEAGDALLQTAAAVLASAFRADDIVARIGGDEFVALLPNLDAAAVKSISARINNAVSIHARDSTGPPLSLSIGVALGDKSCRLSEILREADNSMYEDKKRRKELV